MLESFITKNPEFAPAYYELSREFSELRLGTQSLEDKRDELESLEKFISLNNNGKFLKYFVDKELAAKWLEDARKRLKALSLVSKMRHESPVSISANKSNQGWRIRVEISEMPQEVFWKLSTDNEFTVIIQRYKLLK